MQLSKTSHRSTHSSPQSKSNYSRAVCEVVGSSYRKIAWFKRKWFWQILCRLRWRKLSSKCKKKMKSLIDGKHGAKIDWWTMWLPWRNVQVVYRWWRSLILVHLSKPSCLAREKLRDLRTSTYSLMLRIVKTARTRIWLRGHYKAYRCKISGTILTTKKVTDRRV